MTPCSPSTMFRLLFAKAWLPLSLVATLLAYLWIQDFLQLPEKGLHLDSVIFVEDLAVDDVVQGVELEPKGWSLKLPDHWRSRGFTGEEGWYISTLRFNVAPDRLWGLYMPSIGTNAAVYVNGSFIGSGGRMEMPPARNDFRPLYFVIPNGMLGPGKNVLAIRVVSDTSSRGYLGKVLLGPDVDLRPYYQHSYFIRVVLVQFILVSLLVSAFFVGFLAWRTRKAEYATFTGMLLATSMFHLSVVTTETPLPGGFWDWLRMMGTGWLVVFIILFNHRMFGLRRPRVERLLLAWAVAGSIVLAAVPVEWQNSTGWNIITILWGIYALLTSMWVCSRTRQVEHFAITLSVLVMLAAGVRDWWMYEAVPEGYQGTLLLYAILYPLLVFAWLLTRQFIAAMEEAETLNRELEARVALRERQLASNFQKLAEAQRQQALVEERERIMRDMHDGIGGQLVTAAEVARAIGEEALVDSVEGALSDLRLMIDSFEPVDGDLATVLGMVRMRLEGRLERHGLKFRWNVGDLTTIPELSSHKVLQVMRVVEEAVTNVIRHAQAKVVEVSAYNERRAGVLGVTVEIRDEGKGMPEDVRKGRGLDNMRYRAESIGGELTVENASPGVVVRMWLPAGNL